jgi:glyoxylase I family protein
MKSSQKSPNRVTPLKRRTLVQSLVGAAAAGWMSHIIESARADDEKTPVFSVWGVRYLVKDVDRAVAFYTKHLDFKLELQAGPAFASVSLGGLTVLLSGPNSSGARPFGDGRKQEPGGWNRLVLRVDDLPSRVAALKEAGVKFRNEIIEGPGGKQIQLEDPDGNPIELFVPAPK